MKREKFWKRKFLKELKRKEKMHVLPASNYLFFLLKSVLRYNENWILECNH